MENPQRPLLLLSVPKTDVWKYSDSSWVSEVSVPVLRGGAADIWE